MFAVEIFALDAVAGTVDVRYDASKSAGITMPVQADPRFTPAEGIRQLRLRLPKRARRRLPLLMLDKAEARRVRLRIVKTRLRLSDKECSA